jgi:hypothetical protein
MHVHVHVMQNVIREKQKYIILLMLDNMCIGKT